MAGQGGFGLGQALLQLTGGRIPFDAAAGGVVALLPGALHLLPGLGQPGGGLGLQGAEAALLAGAAIDALLQGVDGRGLLGGGRLAGGQRRTQLL